MIIDCIADLHGNYPKLEGGDLLIIAGDLTARDTENEHLKFAEWLANQNYRHRVFIGGNHDNQLVPWSPMKYVACDYLRDSGCQFEGFKIWGSPWTRTFHGINPRCTAFTGIERELKPWFAIIPGDTDILVTHGPPFSFLDCTIDGRKVGSMFLLERVAEVRPKLHVFGHIHEAYGEMEAQGTKFVNCSHVNEDYEPVNTLIRIVL